MITDEVFYQCEKCLRYLTPGDPDPVLIVPQPRFVPCVPISCLCQRDDCAAVVEQIRGRDVFRAQKRAERREKRSGPPAGKVSSHGVTASNRLIAAHASAGGTFIGNSCPVDTEFTVNPVMEAANRLRDSGRAVKAIETPAHKDQVEHFGEHGEADSQNDLMLLELRRSFDETHPDVPGGWVDNARLKFELKIGCPNNRAIDLRGGKRVKSGAGWKIRPPHPFIARHDLDVDCSQIDSGGSDAQHFAYRLCLKSQSQRLKNEAERDIKAGQGTLS